jgi:N-acyl-D-amino-acid deacylase
MSWTRIAACLALTLAACSQPASPPLDILVLGGTVIDGSGSDPTPLDVGVAGDRIVFVGRADPGVRATDTLHAAGLLVTPGFIDMHSHAELDETWGKDGLPFLYQGITTAVLGVDGGGTPYVSEALSALQAEGIGLNALTYVGHGQIREMILGRENRPPTAAELDTMKALVRKGMEEGALGLSTGLFYTPDGYASTEEVIELNRVASEYGGIYDTHDRDLGAAYRGIGYLNSIREAIRIGEEGGTPVIFSHFNAQGAHNYGRAPEGAALIEEARERGVSVWAAQHVYTATQSNLRSYTIPDWAAVGTHEEMIRRFDHPDTAAILDGETTEMLEIRGGAEKILFGDPRPELNGRTLAQVSLELGLPVPAAVREILRDGNAVVMNLDLYDIENTRYLARQPWMMTCTDGRTPRPDQEIAHPRPYGAFARKLRQLVLDESVITLPFAVRSMTGLAADFLGLEDRGYVREGLFADLAVLDLDRLRDMATFDEPKRYAEGTVHVVLNGELAFRDGAPTGALAGRALRRGGEGVGR